MIREQIRATDEYQALAAQEEGSATTTSTPSPTPNTVGASLGPLLDVEKTDAMFWMQVAQVILLYLMYRELAGGSR